MEIRAFLIDFDYYPMQFWETILGEKGFSLQHNFGLYCDYYFGDYFLSHGAHYFW